MKRSIFPLFVGSLLLCASATAAPFCAVFATGKQCYYYTYEACLQAVGAQGACVPNQEQSSVSGNAPFCVVGSAGTQCFYYDVQSCRQAASAEGGMCAVNQGSR